MDPAEANNEITEKCIQKSLQYFQNVQEERVILSIGIQEFNTSRVTLRADPNSVLAFMLRKDSPMRPCGNTYYFNRDPSHFRFILNYLRNGAHLEAMTLPHEKRYLMELLAEARFHLLEIILERLCQVTKSNEF